MLCLRRLTLVLCFLSHLPAQVETGRARSTELVPLRGSLHELVEDLVVDGRKAARVRKGGLVVGILADDVRGYLVHGSSGRIDEMPLGPDSVFEIGSITKAFTSMALVAMNRDKKLRLDDPVATLLPEEVTMPVRDDTPITLEHLVLHASGLPRLPTNFKMNPRDPYATYDRELLYAFLGQHKLIRAPEENLEYSNLGFGLLGHVLARTERTDYETTLRRRVLDPLGLHETGIRLDAARYSRLARGHSRRGRPMSPWSFDVLAGAGALRSTLRDMMRLLDQLVAPDTSLLGDVLRLCEPVRRQPLPTSGRTFAWFEERLDVDPGISEGWRYLWHNGGTGGFASFIGWIPEKRTGCVVLANNAFDATKNVAQPLMRALYER